MKAYLLLRWVVVLVDAIASVLFIFWGVVALYYLVNDLTARGEYEDRVIIIFWAIVCAVGGGGMARVAILITSDRVNRMWKNFSGLVALFFFFIAVLGIAYGDHTLLFLAFPALGLGGSYIYMKARQGRLGFSNRD